MLNKKDAEEKQINMLYEILNDWNKNDLIDYIINTINKKEKINFIEKYLEDE